MLQYAVLCHQDSLSESEAKGFDPLNEGKDTLFLIKKEGKFYAYKDICPHYGNTSLPWRKDKYLNAERTAIICSGHAALFDIKTGNCTLGPCIGQSLAHLSLQIDDLGMVSVEI